MPQKDRASEADRLRSLRETLGLSQLEMSRYFQVSPASIAFWENRQRTIPGPALLLLDLFEEELTSAPFPEVFLNPPLKLGVRRALHLAEPALAAGAAKARKAIGLPRSSPSSDGAIDPAVAVQVAIARQVVKSLDEAKGLPVKVAQMLTYFDYQMPFAVKEVFGALRNRALPMNPLLAAKTIQEDLGAPPSRIFAEWEATPFAAASIGQVHRARLKSGERVAVKIQYPGIRETITSDMDGISILGRLAKLILRGSDASPIIEEVREHLIQECDYELEASHQRRFREIFQGHTVVTIPEVHPSYCSRRVLVTSYHEGRSLEEFAAQADQTSRNRIGEALWDYFNLPKYRHGFFNCDPHFGNFIVSGDRLVCLDFGSVKKMSDAYRENQRLQNVGIVHGDLVALRKGIEGMGMIRDPERFNFEAHVHFLSLVALPYRSPQPYPFTEEYRQALWNAMQTNPNKNYTTLPREEVMAIRIHFGELAGYALLRAEANWRDKIVAALNSAASRGLSS